MNIAESLDVQLSKAEFALALDDFVTAWRVNEAMPQNSLLRLLRHRVRPLVAIIRFSVTKAMGTLQHLKIGNCRADEAILRLLW